MHELYNPWRDHLNAVMEGNTSLSTQDYCDILEYMDRERIKVVNFEDQVKQLNSIIRQLEVALRIKKEEHDCCVEDFLKIQSEVLTGTRRMVFEPISTEEYNSVG